ncbi:MAG: type II toxin-antitoxin system Phd/YefM family antitoxin [Acidobacteria bacterium]|nr:type II toxin-antitoxin system Phd/YefM family antitoxin [Acidobacteriota bacterium]
MARHESPQQISISEFKATCLAVLDRVKRTGQPVLVTRRGEPLAQVTPPPPEARPQSWIGCMAGKTRIVGDVVSPATEEGEWEALLP